MFEFLFKRKKHTQENVTTCTTVPEEKPIDYTTIIQNIIKYANSLLIVLKQKYPNNEFKFSSEYKKITPTDSKYIKFCITLLHNRQFTNYDITIKDDEVYNDIKVKVKDYILENYYEYKLIPVFYIKLIHKSILNTYIEQFKNEYSTLIVYDEIKQLNICNTLPTMNVYVNRKNVINNEFITKLNLKFREEYGLYTVPKIIYSDRYDETASIKE